MEFEPMDDFERQLREAMARRPAPPALKRKIFERRDRKRVKRFPSLRIFQWGPATAVLAAMTVVVVIVAAAAGGLLMRRQMEEQRKGEQAKQQVLTALRITGHALQQMNQQLVERKAEMR